MNILKVVIFSVVCLIPLLISGCIDENRIKAIEDTQKDILSRLSAIEKEQEKLAKNIPTKRPVIDYDKVYTIPEGTSPIKGKKNATVTITEFSDYQCPYCARMQPILKEVLNAYPEDVKLVFKDYPLSFHKQARNAAKAAHAAGEQGKFWEMHDVIFENFNKLTEDKFKEFASQIGLDVKKFTSDYNSNKYDQQIKQDVVLARNVGVRGTPTFFVNGKRMQRRSVSDFKEVIDNILKKQGPGKTEK